METANEFDPAECLRRWRTTRAPEALGELLRRQRDRAYAIALRFTGSAADADDVVQEAFLKLLTRTHGFDDTEAFELSVYRAVMQCALDLLKQRRRRHARVRGGAEASEGMTGLAEPDARISGEEREELRALQRSALHELHEDERAPVVLCGQQGLSVAEASRVLEVPRETVRARLKRGLASLRAHLQARDVGPALLPVLLWEEGRASAPEALCRTLDACLPGRPCTLVPAQARTNVSGPGGLLGSSNIKIGLGVAVAGIAAAVLTISIGTGAPAPHAGLHESARVGVERGEVQERAPANAKIRAAPQEREVEGMKRTMSAVVLSAGMLAAPLAANATEPKAEVTQVMKEIEARKAEKAAEQAKVVREYQRRESGERAWSKAAPGGNPQVNVGQ